MNSNKQTQHRHSALGVHSVNRFVFSVPDLEVARHFYESFGLDVRQHGRILDLYTLGHPHCWAQIHESEKGKLLEYVSYGIYPEDEAAFRERLASLGLNAAPHPLSDGAGLWLSSPDGILCQLLPAEKVSPSCKSVHSTSDASVPGCGRAPKRSAAKKVRPRHLSHILMFTPDVKQMIAFSEDVLGLRLSDHSGDLIAFMHSPHGSDHHLVAYAKSHAPGLHHSSWDVGSIDDVGLGSEQMREQGFVKGWGIGRHVLGSNYFYYVQDPWGSFAEYSFDIDFIPSSMNWLAQDHPPADSLYVWGPSVPEDFITNHERAADTI
ncbi:VOC family protein [Herbaspirillum sp. GCM10030257]|uniref:VOC family protein n=1 Tax=Herbaspirillum sp. GCM10030257 TaxID=3273393 RepID=UPI0036068DB2